MNISSKNVTLLLIYSLLFIFGSVGLYYLGSQFSYFVLFMLVVVSIVSGWVLVRFQFPFFKASVYKQSILHVAVISLTYSSLPIIAVAISDFVEGIDKDNSIQALILGVFFMILSQQIVSWIYILKMKKRYMLGLKYVFTMIFLSILALVVVPWIASIIPALIIEYLM